MEECQEKEGIETPSYELLGGKSGGLVMVVSSPHLCFAWWFGFLDGGRS